MMKYLLGMLNETETASIEERYFVDRNLFLKMRAAERRLVESYLDGRLDRAYRRHFRRRYLRTPALQKVVKSIAAEHRPESRHRLQPAWIVALAAIILAVGLVTYLPTRFAVRTHSQVASGQPAPIALVVFPGLLKDANSRIPSVAVPSLKTQIQLIAKIPVRAGDTEYRSRISLIEADGGTTSIWEGPEQTGKTGQEGRQVIVTVSSSMLRPGDYFLELDTADGAIQYRCPFRIIRTVSRSQ